MLNPLYNNALRLAKLVDDVLSITKIESRTLSLDKVKVNVNENISNVIFDIKNQIRDPDKLQIVFLKPKNPYMSWQIN